MFKKRPEKKAVSLISCFLI